jgi:hypothetical protein
MIRGERGIVLDHADQLLDAEFFPGTILHFCDPIGINRENVVRLNLETVQLADVLRRHPIGGQEDSKRITSPVPARSSTAGLWPQLT